MSKYFTRRGEKCVPIKYDEETLLVNVKILTNREHDDMMEAHTEYGAEGSVVTHGAELIEDRLLACVIDLPFDVPTDEIMEVYKPWKDASTEERQIAINQLDPDLRDAINKAIIGVEEISEDTAGN